MKTMDDQGREGAKNAGLPDHVSRQWKFYRGNSMYPAFRRGDEILFRPVDGKTLCQGDVIGFRRKERWIVHRLVKSSAQTLETRGDHCLRSDAPLRRSETPLLLAIAVRRRGRVRPIAGGKCGMWQHRAGQLYKRLTAWTEWLPPSLRRMVQAWRRARKERANN